MKNLSKILSSLILALYLSPIFLSIAALSVYFSNLNFIQNELCENRDRPELKCHGTCVLAKIIEETKPLSKQQEELTEVNEVPILIAFIQAEPSNPFDTKNSNSQSFSEFKDSYSLILCDSMVDPPDFII